MSQGQSKTSAERMAFGIPPLESLAGASGAALAGLAFLGARGACRETEGHFVPGLEGDSMWSCALSTPLGGLAVEHVAVDGEDDAPPSIASVVARLVERDTACEPASSPAEAIALGFCSTHAQAEAFMASRAVRRAALAKLLGPFAGAQTIHEAVALAQELARQNPRLARRDPKRGACGLEAMLALRPASPAPLHEQKRPGRSRGAQGLG